MQPAKPMDDKVRDTLHEKVQENLRLALKRTRELEIPDEMAKPVLKQLLKESGENWGYIKLDNYSPLIDAIYSREEEKPMDVGSSHGNSTRKNPVVSRAEGSSNGNNRKNPVVPMPEGSSNGSNKKNPVVPMTEGSSNGNNRKDPVVVVAEGSSNGNSRKNPVVVSGTPPTVKRNYETRSASSGSSIQPVQKQPQLSNGDRKRKYKNMISDITKGTEKVEISLVDDVGTEEMPKFTYIPQNIAYQKAYIHVNLARISDENCCANCQGDCLSADYPCACAGETKGEYAYTKEGLLKEDFLDKCLKMKKEPDSFDKFYCQACPLERDSIKGTQGQCDGHLIRKFIKECWRKCGCDMLCGNRVVQRGIKCGLQVYFTPEGKGWGVRALQDLPKGTFVCEYIGEILTNSELYDRNQNLSSERHTYPVTLDADWGSEKDLHDDEALCLDATISGNVARFINHRCEDANLIDIPVEIETPDRHYYHIAFFTIRDVKAMDELTWDYMIDFSDESHPVKAFRCSCGSELCRDKRTKAARGKSVEKRKFVPVQKPPAPKAVTLRRR